MNNRNIVFFYTFLILFITIVYFYNKNLISFLPKTSPITTEAYPKSGFKNKKYQESFTKRYDKQSIEIASFEKSENWIGGDDFSYDDINYYDGKTSLTIGSENNKTTKAGLIKTLNLENMGLIKMLVYSAEEIISDNIRLFTLTFEGSSGSFEYNITNVKPGWNIIKMPKDNFFISNLVSSDSAKWNKIKEIRLSLTSRPNTAVELTLDRIWSEQDEDYQNDLLIGGPNMVSLKEFNKKTYLNLWNFSDTNTYFNKITSTINFNYLVKIIPQKNGPFGLSVRTDSDTGYGYFFELGGIGMNSWELYKIGKPNEDSISVTSLNQGKIINYKIEENKPLWLKMTTNNNKITCYFSLDGTYFTKLTEKTDNEIKTGGVGLITKGGNFLLESIDFTQ